MMLFEYLARAFVAEGVDTVFALLGDGNMNWLSAMESEPTVRVIHTRHETAAVAMADGYSRETGRVGVAAVTCGPGLTQIATSLTAAVRHHTPMVVFTGETPLTAAYHLQAFAQEPFVRSTGAEFLRVGSVEQAGDVVAQAFVRALRDRTPVVLSVPYDVQEEEQPWDVYTSSAELLPELPPVQPAPEDLDATADLLRSARRPLILAGAGALSADCRAAMVTLADDIDAYLATTLRALGLFDGQPRNLGVCGAFASEAVRAQLADVDVVLGVGASLGYHTTEGGYIFPGATIIQLDSDPVGLIDGQRAAQRYVRSDSLVGLRGLLPRLRGGAANSSTLPKPAQWQSDSDIVTNGDGVVHPAAAARAINDAVPADGTFLIGAGHFWNFVVPTLAGRDPSQYHFTYDFGVIGQGIPTAIGVCAGIGYQPMAVVEGDGSLLMNVQELETITRLKLPLLIMVMNDGALGAEYHKLNAKGRNGDIAMFGRTDLARIAAGFGLKAVTIDDCGALGAACAQFYAEPQPTLLDVRIDHTVPAATYRRLFYGESTISFDAAAPTT